MLRGTAVQFRDSYLRASQTKLFGTSHDRINRLCAHPSWIDSMGQKLAKFTSITMYLKARIQHRFGSSKAQHWAGPMSLTAFFLIAYKFHTH